MALVLAGLLSALAARASALPQDYPSSCDPQPYPEEEKVFFDHREPEVTGKETIKHGQTMPGHLTHGMSVPPQLGATKKIYPFGCNRQFVYHEKIYPVDSYNRQDGERLRPILQDTPAAILELDDYQAARRKARTTAYFGSAAIFVSITSFFAAGQFNGRTHDLIREIGGLGGLAFGFGLTVYSFAILRSNENRLESATQIYNKTHPDDSILLQLNAGMSF